MVKGYDSESIHSLIREELNADSIIPIRSWKNERVGGIFRREMDEHFDEVRYHRRTLVETKFSVLKRKFGGDLKTRKFSNQRKELTCKMIICNLHQFLQFVMIEVFYRAKCETLFVIGLDKFHIRRCFDLHRKKTFIFTFCWQILN